MSDRGGEFANEIFTHGLASLGVHFRLTPTEAPWSIGRVERHHDPVRHAYLMTKRETPELDRQLALALAFKARNDTRRAHGLSPHECAYGEKPRLLIGDNRHSDPSIASRHREMQAARNYMEKYVAADRLKRALTHPGRTVPVEVGKQVVFHRHKNAHGPWLHGTVQAIDGSTVYINHDDRKVSAQEARVKPFVEPAKRSTANQTPTPLLTQPAPHPPPHLPTSAQVFNCSQVPTNKQCTPPIDIMHHSHPRWDQPNQAEFNTFRALHAMRAVPREAVPKDAFIFPYT